MSNKYKIGQVVKIDSYAMGIIKELPNDKSKGYLCSVGCDLIRIDPGRMKPLVKSTGQIKKDERRNG
jgi:hypothetical protein